MNHKPLISIVIPTYNHANFLNKALKSVIAQTYDNWEAVVIDNHSLDNTDEVVAGFINPRITYLKIHNDGVIAASRNAGIKAAKGEWIAFLDSDDWWSADKLQICSNAISKNVDFIYHYLEIVSSKPRYLRKKLLKTPQISTPAIIDLLINGNQIINSSVVVRKKLLLNINGINEDKRIIASEDYDTWLRIAMLTDKFLCIPLKLGFYRVHNTNTSNIAMRDMSIADKIILNDFIDMLDISQKAKIEARLNYAKGRFNYYNDNYMDAFSNLFHALVCHHKVSFRLKAFISLFMLIIKIPFFYINKYLTR